MCYITLCSFIYSLNWCLYAQTDTVCGYLTNWLHSENSYLLWCATDQSQCFTEHVLYDLWFLLGMTPSIWMCSQFCMNRKENVPVFVKDKFIRTLAKKDSVLFCTFSTSNISLQGQKMSKALQNFKYMWKYPSLQNPSIHKDGKAISWI